MYGGSHVCVSLVVDSLTSQQLKSNYSVSDISLWPGLHLEYSRIFEPVLHSLTLSDKQYDGKWKVNESSFSSIEWENKVVYLHVFIMVSLGFFFSGDGFHLCDGDTQPGLICVLYPSSMGKQLSLKYSQALLSVMEDQCLLSSSRKHLFDLSIALFFIWKISHLKLIRVPGSVSISWETHCVFHFETVFPYKHHSSSGFTLFFLKPTSPMWCHLSKISLVENYVRSELSQKLVFSIFCHFKISP